MLAPVVVLALAQANPAQVRVVNAAVDVSPAVVSHSGVSFGSIPYGGRTEYNQVPGGKGSVAMETLRGERIANPQEVHFQPGYPHTLILAGRVASTGQMRTIVLRDTTAGKPSMSSVQLCFVNALADATPITIKVNGKELKRPKQLMFGESSPFVNYTPREFDFAMFDAIGKQLYSAQTKGKPGTRLTAIAMGAQGLSGNRSPRLFIYEF